MQINLNKADWVKTGLLVLVILLLILFFRQCGSVEKYELANKELKNTIKKSDEIVKIKEAEIKQIKAEKTDLRKAIENQKSKTDLLKQKLSKIDKSKIDKSRKVLTKTIKVPTICEEPTKELQKENEILKEVVASQDSTITQQDSLDALSEREIIKLNDINAEKDFKELKLNEIILNQEKSIKKVKSKIIFRDILIGGLIIFGIAK